MSYRALFSLTSRCLAPRPPHISRGLQMVVLPQARAASLLPESASIEVHHYMSQVLDMWHFYSSLNLALREERLLGVQALTRELARQHWQDRRDSRDRSNVILAGYDHWIEQG